MDSKTKILDQLRVFYHAKKNKREKWNSFKRAVQNAEIYDYRPAPLQLEG